MSSPTLEVNPAATAAAPTPQAIARPIFTVLVLLSLAMFAQATTAFSVVGSFGAIGREWHLNTTESALLLTAFGATFAVSAPVLQMLVGHWVRRTQILTGLGILAGGALLFSAAPNFPMLLVARVLMGLGAGLIGPVLSALGSSIVKPQQQGAALAIVIMGLSIASVVGVPLCAWISLQVGPRLLFVALAALIALTASLIVLFVKDSVPGQRVSLTQVRALLSRGPTISALSVIFLFAAGVFATYGMITPFMRDIYAASPATISLALLVYGVAGLVGNLFVRRAAGRYSAVTLLRSAMLGIVAVFAALLVLPVSMAILLAVLVAWPFISDIVWPSQQRRIVELEPAMRGIALAFTVSFMFSGIAAGSWIGGLVYSHFGFSALLVTSIALVLAALAALMVSVRAAAQAR